MPTTLEESDTMILESTAQDAGKVNDEGTSLVELCLICRIRRRAADLKLPMDAALKEAALREQELRKTLKCDVNSKLCRLCNIESDINTLCTICLRGDVCGTQTGETKKVEARHEQEIRR